MANPLNQMAAPAQPDPITKRHNSGAREELKNLPLFWHGSQLASVPFLWYNCQLIAGFERIQLFAHPHITHHLQIPRKHCQRNAQ